MINIYNGHDLVKIYSTDDRFNMYLCEECNITFAIYISPSIHEDRNWQKCANGDWDILKNLSCSEQMIKDIIE